MCEDPEHLYRGNDAADDLDNLIKEDAIRVAKEKVGTAHDKILSPPAILAGEYRQRGGVSEETTVRVARFGPLVQIERKKGANQFSRG